MPPPPPPSASYLWKFDDLSDDSDDNEQLPKYSKGSYTEERRIEDLSLSSPGQTLPPPHPLPSASKQPSHSTVEATLMPTAESTVSPSGVGATATQDLAHSRERILRLDKDIATDALNTTCEVQDNDEEQSVSGDDNTVKDPRDASDTTSISRKRKNRRKKKKKQHANLITPLVNHRAVSFGFVSVRSFDRCLGGTVVPCDGGWPLGMEDRAYTEDTISVTEYETSKQERLLNRLQSIRQHLYKESSSSPTLSSKKGNADIAHDPPLAATPPDLPLETRQWDYKHKVKNPLFSSLSEQGRMELLLKSSSVTSGTDHHHPSSTSPDSLANSRKHVRHNPRGHHHHHHHTNSADTAPTFVAPSRTRSRSGSFTEQYNDVYTQVEVHHCRNELEQIRNFRTMEGSTGCSCRKLQVYLLPPNAGKKAHHRRMNLHKVKEELRKRHLLPPEGQQQHSREELELLLHDTVEGEPCCRADSCPCARNGIECQADSCTCWYTSHQTKQTQHDEHTNHSTTDAGGNNNQHRHNQTSSSSSNSIITLEEIKARCGNPLGMSTVDADKIDAFRRNYLSNLTVISRDTTAITSNSSPVA